VLRRRYSDKSTASRIDAGLTQCVESERTLDPRETVINWLANWHLVVCIAAVETGLATVVPRPQLVNADSALAKPELALRLTAREDDVRELLDLLSHCRVGGMTHTRSAVVGTTRYGDQDVPLRPIAFAEDFPQLGKIDLELGGPVRERGSIIPYCRIGTLARSDQVITSRVKAVAIRTDDSGLPG
jgi:hypothetical protein